MDGVGNCTRCPKLSPSLTCQQHTELNAEVVIQCGTIFEPKGFDISRLCHSNLSRSEGHSFCGRKKRVHLRSISDPHLSSSCFKQASTTNASTGARTKWRRRWEQQNQNPMAFSIRLPDSWSDLKHKKLSIRTISIQAASIEYWVAAVAATSHSRL